MEDLDEDGDKDSENLSELAYGRIGIGIIGVILAIVEIAMLLKKKSPPQISSETQEAPTTPSTPEQQVTPENEIIPQEQPQVTSEVQSQDIPQVQQSEEGR